MNNNRRDFYEEIRKHDEATALGHARREGIAAGRIEANKAIAQKLRSSGYSLEQIKALLGDDYIG